MRTRSARSASSLLLLLLLALLAAPARADEDDPGDDYEVTARVARVSLVKGDVSLRRNGDNEWERAELNYPLVEGDTLSTGPEARAEFQIDAHNFVRLGPGSVLRVVTLRDEGVALSLNEGTATLRLARFDKDREYFELDAPGATVAAEHRGLYRLDVSPRVGVVVVARDGARARIYSETSGFTLREGRTARLSTGGDAAGDWELSSAPAFDEWDSWTDERERHLAASLRYENRERYYDREVWGAEELDAHGQWTHTRDYGWVWRPHATAINHYNDWAPYRYGRWVYFQPYGWTWVGDEPWGWAPYHYGRWVYHDNYWAWAPRGYGYTYRRAWWRPALVAFVFVSGSRGDEVCWYPLRHGQRDPHSGFWRRNARRLHELRDRQRRDVYLVNPAYLRAVSSLPSREFGARVRGRRAHDDLARRAVSGEPVARLPFERRRGRDGATGEGQRTFARPARDLIERPTGAARRAPGVALDRELRRTRIFNNREPRNRDRGPRDSATTPNGTPGDGSTLGRGAGSLGRGSNTDAGRDTGVVARPAPTGDGTARDENRTRRPGRRDDNNGARNGERDATPRVDNDGTRRGDDGSVWRRIPRVERPDSRNESRNESRPERRVERSAPREERPRSERPPREERPREERPRQERPREDRPAREERPQRSEPRQERSAPRERAPERPSRPAGRDTPVTRDNDN
ncbi:MAG TPA: DUF6600 domain-containing protein [Pyrinomonadaceae bacterium]|nr:DUF6600 domain-containing protein [Pyrinomonadaceae bacterium]